MYSQKYHRFDSFYNHKFAFHITGPRKDAFEAVFRIRPKVVKTLDFSVEVMKRIRREIPDVFLIGRLFVHPQDFGQLSGGTVQAARRQGVAMAEKILREEVNRDIHHINGQPIFHAWESLNEVFPESTGDDTQKLYDEYQVAFGQKMKAAGFEPIAFNFGQGNGRGQQWLKLYPGTLEIYKYLGFHEYDWPTMDRLHQIGLSGPHEPQNLVPGVGEGRGNDGMWRCLRYRRIMNEGIRQRYGDQHVVIITECGMTQGVWGGAARDIGPWAAELTVPADIPGGVVSTPISVDDYWRTLLWYNSEILKDEYVMAACLFVTGASGRPEWKTFEHLGPIMDRIAAFQQEASFDTSARTPVTSTGRPASPQPATAANFSRLTAFRPSSQPAADRTPTAAAPPPLSPPASSPQKPPRRWTYTLEVGRGLGLLVGDIGLANETITVVKPNGMTERLTAGSKPEFGPGGFEIYANIAGTYRLQFLGQTFEVPLNGQFTRITFKQVADARVVEANLSFRHDRTAYAVGERVFVKVEVTNVSSQPVSFGLLGLLTSNDRFQTSWNDGLIQPGETFRHEDGLAFNAPGTYKVQPAICFSKTEACWETESGWTRLEPSLEVTVG